MKRKYGKCILIVLFPACASLASNEAEMTEREGEEAGLSISLKSVFIGRDDGLVEQQAGSSSITLDYFTREWRGMSVGAEFVVSQQHETRGLPGSSSDPSYQLHLNSFDVLNELFFKYRLDSPGFSDTYVVFGRQAIDLQFARKYNIRHKNQAFEGIVLHLGDFPKWTFDLGHFEKFSDWSSRARGGSRSAGFLDMSVVEDVSYEVDGIQFVEAAFSSLKDTKMNLYGYYGRDLYLTLGASVDHGFGGEVLDIVLRGKVLYQESSGRYKDFSVTASQVGVKIGGNRFSIEPGVFLVDGATEHQELKTPFQPNLIIEEPLYETDAGFLSGSRTAYLEMQYVYKKSNLYVLMIYTDFDDLRGEENISEVDVIYSRKIGDRYELAFKGAVARYNYREGEDREVLDLRTFVSYEF